MNFTKCCFVNVTALAGVFCFYAPAAASQSSLVMRSSPENARALPAENVVSFAAGNPTLHLQLDVMAGSRGESFASTTVTVVDQAGNARKYKPDAQGVVKVAGLQKGLYTVIAFNKWAHGAMVFAARQDAGEPDSDSPLFDDTLGKDFADKAPAAELRVTMMRTVREKLVPLVIEKLVDDAAAPVYAIDKHVVDILDARRPYKYQVKLGRGGVLRGQLISLMHRSSKYSAVKGTRITVMKNGIPVGTTTANALGQFQIGGLRQGVHGLVVAGRGGYAAMSFQAVNSLSIADNQTVRLVSSQQVDSPFGGTMLSVAIVPPTHVPAVLASVREFYPNADSIKSSWNRMSAEQPAVLEIGDAHVSLADIGDDYVNHFDNDAEPNNPLRSCGCSTSSSSSSSSSFASSLGGSGFGGLVGVAGAIAVPIAAADDDAPGLVSTNAGL